MSDQPTAAEPRPQPPQPPEGTGDPGEQRMYLLRASVVFSNTPPGSLRLGDVVERKASWNPATGRWSDPVVSLRFMSNAPAATVYGFVANLAAGGGWTPTGINPFGFANTWQRIFRADIGASLALYVTEGDPSIVGSTSTYLLTGAIAAINP